MHNKDVLRRFLFDGLAIRGEWINLTASWQAAKHHHQYPDAVMQQLGEAIAAATLLSASVKFEGNLILQAQGDGAIKTLVAQSTNTHEIRGWARCDNTAQGDTLSDLLGAGHIVLTVEPDKGEPYQGIVALSGERLQNAIEAYFAQSEQLRTRLWLFADTDQAAGLLIQELPSKKNAHSEENWARIEALANTISKDELLSLACEDVLYRLFNEEQVRLFGEEPVSFKCRCSAQKVESTLVSLGQTAIDEIIEEQGEILVDCEFCSRQYHFDKIDVTRLFSELIVQEHNTTRH